MKKRSVAAILITGLLMVSTVLTGCNGSKTSADPQPSAGSQNQVVNVFSERHYETDKQLFETFTNETGIKVNVIEGKADELIERMTTEGLDSQADLFITADVGRLHRAKERGLLQSTSSDIIAKNVPENLRDKDNHWYGLTVRARVLVYDKDKLSPAQLSTYEDLVEPKWNGKIIARTSGNIYNQSLLASFITINGEEEAKAWAKGIVANMARTPKGNDRDQAKAVIAGEGEVAIMNTYYLGQMANSADPEEVKVAQKVGVFFPNQNTTGTHINVSGAGITKASKNKENAIKLVEFLTSVKAQYEYANANYEYPVNEAVEASDLVKSWGEFKSQNINLTLLGEHNKKAVEIFDQVGWK